MTRGCFRTGCLVAGGDPAVEEEDTEEEENDPEGFSGLGAIGMADSTVLLYAGYPSHCRPERTHFRPSLVSRYNFDRIAERTLWSSLVAFHSPVSGHGSARHSADVGRSETHLQLLHPVLTLGLLALLCFFTVSSFGFGSSIVRSFSAHASLVLYARIPANIFVPNRRKLS